MIPEVTDLLTPSSETQVDSDEVPVKKPGKRGRPRIYDSDDDSSKRSKSSKAKEPEPTEMLTEEVKEIIKLLDTTELRCLSPTKQIALLYTLYQAVCSLDIVKKEQEQRMQTFNKLLLEQSSVQLQLQELQNVYTPQEYNLREAYNSVINEKFPNGDELVRRLSKTYKPSDKSKYPAEKALAAFLGKKDSVLSGITSHLEQLRSQVLTTSCTTCTMSLLGCDRYQNEYYLFLEDTLTRIWVYYPDQDRWGYYWRSSQVQMLFDWLDNRGSREQEIYSSLCYYRPLITRLMDESAKWIVTVSAEEPLSSLSKRKRSMINQFKLVQLREEIDIANAEGVLTGTNNRFVRLYQICDGGIIGIPQWTPIEENNNNNADLRGWH